MTRFSFLFQILKSKTSDYDFLMNECVQALGAEEISKSNPVVVAEKVAKIQEHPVEYIAR